MSHPVPTHRLIVALAVLVVALAGTTLAVRAEESTPEPVSERVMELPNEIGQGPSRDLTVLVDEPHLRLAVLDLPVGTALPPHAAPVPTTIQVLEGDGILHVEGEAVPLSKGTLVTLLAGEEHDVELAPGSGMLLLVHYLRGGADDGAEHSH